MRKGRKAPRGIVLPAAIAAVLALLVAGLLGVASAEAPPASAPTPTVSVEGVANESIEPSASAATATTVYRQGMADAINDGLAKAQFLASKAGVTLGAVQSIVENGGYIGCSGTEEVEYLGEQPDFGSSSGPINGASVGARSAHGAPVASRPSVKHAKKRPKRKAPVAKRASAAGCTLSAQVSLVYAIS